ncbi:MAG: putative S-layer protein [Nanoarchaeota archaeon]|nr:putative S-layer protein [Nanoarchaeota archaeon]
MLKKIFSVILLVFIIMPLIQAQITNVSIDPTSASVEMMQNDHSSFDITFTNTNTNDVTLEFSYDQIEDNDGDEIILALPSTFTVPASGSNTFVVNINSEDNIDLEEYRTTITITNSLTNETINFPLTVLVTPGICDFGQAGNDLEIEIKDPDSGDDYSPGDTVIITVDVKNVGNSDMDVQLEAFLFNEGEILESSASKRRNIETDEEETFEFTINIPEDNNEVNEDENYKIFIKAFDDNNEDQNCIQDSLSIDITLEKHDVKVKDTSRFSTPVVACNTEVTAFVDIVNIGEKDEDVRISIENEKLSINMVSDTFEIESFGSKDDNEASRSFKIKIPDNIMEGTYNFLAKVLFAGKTETRMLPLEIINCKPSFEESEFDFASASLFIKSDKIVDLKPKDSTAIHVFIENNAPTTQILFIKLKNIEQVGEGSTSTVTIPAFQSSNIFLPLNINQDTEDGMYTAVVELSNGSETLSSDTITLNIASKNQENLIESSTEGFSSAGLLILNIILIFIITAVVLLLKNI